MADPTSMTLAEARIRTECHTEKQADLVIETVKRLGCWPDDFVIETEPFDLPGGYVYVGAGARKGRLYAFGVAPDGAVSS